MYIVKDLNDFTLNKKQRVFVDFISDKIGTYFSYEKIRNREYIKKSLAPKNEFVSYNNASPYKQIHRLKIDQQKSTY